MEVGEVEVGGVEDGGVEERVWRSEGGEEGGGGARVERRVEGRGGVMVVEERGWCRSEGGEEGGGWWRRVEMEGYEQNIHRCIIITKYECAKYIKMNVYSSPSI